MCGIAGHLGPRRLPEARLEACAERMRRRGPDHQGRHHAALPQGTHAHLLASRLRIIDLDDRADQPLRLGPRTLVFNGELYNYRELRTDLERGGAAFATSSDTEVLLHALDRWGWSALDRCEGMWAFALLDESSGTLALCRDRFGEKPLYLHEGPDGLTFGSEVKFLAALSGHGFRVDREHLRRYLAHGHRVLHKDDRTFFQDVRALPPATLLLLGPGARREARRYWTPRVAPDPAMTYAAAVEGVRSRLLRAVELRLRADVPLAFCLSGGVDSTALASVARRLLGHEVHGFTIANDDPRYDESAAVSRTVAELGVRHTFVPVATEGFLEGLEEAVRYHDAPLSTITSYMQWLLMGAIHAAGYRVAISGTGADELFTGYYDHHLAYLHGLAGDSAARAAALAAWERRVLPFVRNPALRDAALFDRDPGARHHLSLESAASAAFLRHPFTGPFTEGAYAPTLLRNRMLNELFHEIVPVTLHEEDLNAMFFSVENRSPFLDRALFEFLATVPDALLIRDGRAKALLRDALEGVLPEHVRGELRKVGFNASIRAFLDVASPKVREQLLADSPIFDLVDRGRVAALLDRRDLTDGESKFLFCFVSAKLFLEAFGGDP